MKSIAWQILGNRPDAEDAVQETFLKLYRGIDAFHGQSSIGTWLCRILINACHDVARKRKREAEPQTEEKTAGPKNQLPLKVALDDALRRIHPRHRMVFLLFEVEGLKHARDRGHSRSPGGDLEGLAVRGQEGTEAHADGDTAMILECSDLERALRTPELMPDMRAHAEQCAACREQLYLWEEISRLAPGLHEEWESPFLWSRIQANLAAEPARRAGAMVALGAGGRWGSRAGGGHAATVAERETGQPGLSHGKRLAGSATGRNGRTHGRSRSSRRWRRKIWNAPPRRWRRHTAKS